MSLIETREYLPTIGSYQRLGETRESSKRDKRIATKVRSGKTKIKDRINCSGTEKRED
jgi:hypothetical protein